MKKRNQMSDEKKHNSWSEYASSQEYKEMLDGLDKIKQQNKQDAKDFYKSLSYENQMLCFFYVVSCLAEAELDDNGTYRYILYDKMGFGTDSYSMGMDFGLMDLHNSIYTNEELESSLNTLLKFLEIEIDDKKFKSCLDIIKYGYKSTLDFKNKQLHFEFE